jgi:hypothetical protein
MRTRTTADNMRSHSFKTGPKTFYGYIQNQDDAENAADVIIDLAWELSRLPDATHEVEHMAGEILKTAKALRSWTKRQTPKTR